MRVLVVDPGIRFSVGDVCRGLTKGLEATGNIVRSFSTGDRITMFEAAKLPAGETMRPMFEDPTGVVAITNQMLRGAILDLNPDLVVIVSGFFVNRLTYDVLRARGIRTCAVMTEQPYELGRELRIAEQVDCVALNDPTHIDRFREVCPNVWYQPHAFDPSIHYPGDGSHDFDAWWCGTGYNSRAAFLEAAILSGRWPHHAKVGLAGNWQALDDRPGSPLVDFLVDRDETDSCVNNADTAEGYRRAAMSWNTYRASSMMSADLAALEAETPDLTDGWAVGPREIELAACGTFFARESRPEGDDLFPMLPIISEPGELADVLSWSIAHPDARNDAALKAREAVADRTFDRTAAELLRRSGF